MALSVSVRDVTKRFGSTVALDRVSLDFTGRVNLVLGTNGSGKSTLINVIAGLTYPDEGTLTINGEALTASKRRAWRRGIESVRAKMGFMLDRTGYPTYLEGEEFLDWSSSPENRRWVESLISILGMSSFTHKSIGGYSSGMTQKVGLSASVAAEPRLVLWDEPTANLDAATRSVVAQLISELTRKGVSFIISSHTPEDFEGVADWICVMQLGKVLASGRIAELSSGSSRFVLESDRPSLIAAEALRAGIAVKAQVEANHVELETYDSNGAQRIRDIPGILPTEIRSIQPRRKTVSELYAATIGKGHRSLPRTSGLSFE